MKKTGDTFLKWINDNKIEFKHKYEAGMHIINAYSPDGKIFSGVDLNPVIAMKKAVIDLRRHYFIEMVSKEISKPRKNEEKKEKVIPKIMNKDITEDKLEKLSDIVNDKNEDK